MGHIIPKLNLNKTPQAVDSNGLVFAKNIKVNTDGSLGRDNSIDNVEVNGRILNLKDIAGWNTNDYSYLGHIVGVNGCIYLFMKRTRSDVDSYFIYEYNEVENTINVVTCNWSYHGGKITGCVTTNNTNQKILTVSEYDCEELVPLKHINLSECKNTDDESIYTQNPNIPITNLHFAGYYSCTIPNGVYQFFVRYKVRDGFYTNWFPASRELYAGHAKKVNTIQGSLKYVDLTKDCDRSFIFEVSHLFNQYIRNYKEFQIGFIVSSDNQVVARTWKSFNFGTTQIYFDYNKNFIEEALVDDFINVNYNIFNAKNVITYKNKLYVSNYIESDLNPKLSAYASNIGISLKLKEIDLENVGIFGINGHTLEKNLDDYYNRININSTDISIGEALSNSEIVTTNSTNTVVTQSFYGAIPQSAYSDISNNVGKYGIYFILISCIDYDTDNNQVLVPISILSENPHFNNLDEIGRDYPYVVSETGTLFTNNIKFCDRSENIINYILSLSEVKSKITYIGDDNNFYVKTTIGGVDKYLELDDIQFSYFSLDISEGRDVYNDTTSTIVWEGTSYTSPVTLTTIRGFCHNNDVNLTIRPNSITSILGYNIDENMRSLLPYTKYNFYIHYVSNNGIVTNGFYIGQKEYNIFTSDDLDIGGTPYVIYPTFTNIQKPDGYAAFFISAIKSQNDIAVLIDTDASTNNLYDCIELDSLLYSSNELLELGTISANAKFKVLTNEGKYYGSNTDVVKYFGTAGFVDAGNVESTPIFIKFSNIIDVRDINNLVKITPFIELEDNPVNVDNDKDLNLLGFICEVTKLNRTEADKIYVSGFDVFDKQLNSSQEYDANINEINEFVDLKTTDMFYIWSNFNLNCLTLRENLNKGIRSWNETVDNTDVLKKQYIVSVNSQNCSLIYDLPLMYKEYTRKYYSVVDDKTFTVFDNTVRSSNVDIDEVFRSVYKFDAEDYYNVPTNRGIIVNLFSINNEIFVHTEHGLFKFTDSSLLKVGDNLYSSNKEVGVSESSPFEIGIAEIVDSQYGHGGLQNKEHALITFNGYIFYDSLVRNIYSYDNQSGIQNITSPVRKVIDWFEPTDVTFVSDDANNRFFITLSKVVTETIDGAPTDVKKVICLSYSFISKSFVSIHDINYDYAFNSRLNTYFIQGNNFLKVDYSDFGSYVNNYHSVLTINDEVAFNEDSVGSCIDIIVNDGFEVIKSLSHIHWICSNINNYVGENPYNVAEEVIDEYGGDSIRVYSDQTWSDLLPIDTKQNTQQINSANSYQYPRYNNGIWTMNYFRDIKNAESNYVSDEMSLIHGKYIVVRFIFGANKKNFKFENLNINFKNYEKV